MYPCSILLVSFEVNIYSAYENLTSIFLIVYCKDLLNYNSLAEFL